MAFDFKFPDVGEGIQEGEVVKWLVKEGDDVKEDQNIVQVETDKAVVDLPSPKTGKILKIYKKEGETIKVGETLVSIGEKGEKINAKEEKKTKNDKADKKIKKETQKKKGNAVVGELEEAPEDEEIEEKTHVAIMKGPTESKKVLALLSVRKKAAELGIDLTKIEGSGKDGIVLMKDIQDVKEEIPQQTIVVKKKYDDFGYVERVPLKGIRKSIAVNLSESAKIPQVTIMEDIDVTRILGIKEKEKKNMEKEGVKFTLLPFIIKAAISALKENPMLNASLENDEIIIKKYFNIGIAVETDVGLMVPVIKIAEKKNVKQLAKEISELAEKARTRTIDVMDLQGGTFTITNYGSIGGTYATPLINPGESSILGLGKIFESPIMDKKGKIKTVKKMPVSFTFDHRVADGAQASRFIEKLKMFMEDPDHLLLELD